MRAWLGAALVAVGALAIVTLAQPARAAGRDPGKEAVFIRELEKIDPALVAPFQQGTAALDAERFADARAAFEKVLARAPDHAATLRRLSYALDDSGEPGRALQMASRARAVGPAHEGDFAVGRALLAQTQT